MLKVSFFIVFLSFNMFFAYSKDSDLIIIDFIHAEEVSIPMSKIFKKIEYIPLELTKECLIKPHYSIFATDQYILIVNVFNGIYMFDRKNGHFIKEISGFGNDPNQYMMTILRYSFSPDKNMIFVDCGNKWRGIDVFQNKSVIEVKKPQTYYSKFNIHQGSINNPFWYMDNLFLGYTNNINGYYPDKLLLFNEQGEVLKRFPNYMFYSKDSYSDQPYNNGVFYKYRDKIYFKESFVNDTVFYFDGNRLSPHIVFDFGNRKTVIKSNQLEDGTTIRYEEYTTNSVLCSQIIETDQYILFNCSIIGKGNCSCYYDKKTKQTFRMPITLMSESGFVNDFDNFLTFRPEIISSDGLIVGSLSPEDILLKNGNNKLKSKSNKVNMLLSNMEYDDNPIIIIATLR